MSERTSRDCVASAIAFVRREFYSDGAEGESVHLIADELEAALVDVDRLRQRVASLVHDGALEAVDLASARAQRDQALADLAALRSVLRAEFDEDDPAKIALTARMLARDVDAALAERDRWRDRAQASDAEVAAARPVLDAVDRWVQTEASMRAKHARMTRPELEVYRAGITRRSRIQATRVGAADPTRAVDASSVQETTAQLHARRAHPGYEYETTTAPRRSADEARPDGDGWEPNDCVPCHDYLNGAIVVERWRSWDRLEYHEEMHWRRRVSGQPVGAGS